jgi:hypothetical protein
MEPVGEAAAGAGTKAAAGAGADPGGSGSVSESGSAGSRSGTGSDRESCSRFSELLWSYIDGYWGVAGVSPAEGVAENVRAVIALAVAARWILPPPSSDLTGKVEKWSGCHRKNAVEREKWNLKQRRC